MKENRKNSRKGMESRVGRLTSFIVRDMYPEIFHYTVLLAFGGNDIYFV